LNCISCTEIDIYANVYQSVGRGIPDGRAVTINVLKIDVTFHQVLLLIPRLRFFCYSVYYYYYYYYYCNEYKAT